MAVKSIFFKYSSPTDGVNSSYNCHATVFRDLQPWDLSLGNGIKDARFYNVNAKAEDCTLLPFGKRNNHIWSVPTAKYTKSFGFGQSMVWYPTEPTAKVFLERLIDNINNYTGENWLYKFPE